MSALVTPLCLACAAPAALVLSSSFTDEKRRACDRCVGGMLHDFLSTTGAAVTVQRVAAAKKENARG